MVYFKIENSNFQNLMTSSIMTSSIFSQFYSSSAWILRFKIYHKIKTRKYVVGQPQLSFKIGFFHALALALALGVFPLKKSVSPIFQNGLWEPNTANSTAKLIIILIPIGIIKVYLRILLFYSLEYKMAVEAGRTLLELSLFLVFDLTCLTLYFYLRAFFNES